MCYLIEYIVAYRMEISTSLRKKMRSVAAGYGLTAGEGKTTFDSLRRHAGAIVEIPSRKLSLEYIV